MLFLNLDRRQHTSIFKLGRSTPTQNLLLRNILLLYTQNAEYSSVVILIFTRYFCCWFVYHHRIWIRCYDNNGNFSIWWFVFPQSNVLYIIYIYIYIYIILSIPCFVLIRSAFLVLCFTLQQIDQLVRKIPLSWRESSTLILFSCCHTVLLYGTHIGWSW